MTALESAINLPWWMDAMTVVAFAVIAVVQGQRIAWFGGAADRWLQATGWAGLAWWWAARLFYSGDVRTNAISIAMVLLIGAGSLIAAWKQMRIARADLRCIQSPQHQCFREDRVRLILTRDT